MRKTKHSHGVTPLHLAAYSGAEALVHRLIDAGSPASARDKKGRTASAWARRRGHIELAAALARLEAGRSLAVHSEPKPAPAARESEIDQRSDIAE